MKRGVAVASLVMQDQTLAKAYDNIEETNQAMNQLAKLLGVDSQVLATTITDMYGLKGTTDKDIIAIDVNEDNRDQSIEVLGHEISHNQGVSKESLANLAGKTTALGFTAAISANQNTINVYQNNIGTGQDLATQENNVVVLDKNNQAFFDQISEHPDKFENYTTTNMAVAFSEKINSAINSNNPALASELLNIYADYMSKKYKDYKIQMENKTFLGKVNVEVDGVAEKAKYPSMLSGDQLKTILNIFPKGSKEYQTVQNLVKMQDEVSQSYKSDNRYSSEVLKNYNTTYIYPGQSNYVFSETYSQRGIQNNTVFVEKMRADEITGFNAIYAMGGSSFAAIGSGVATLFGAEQATSQNVAIGIAIAANTLGAGVAAKTNPLAGTALDRAEVVVPVKNVNPSSSNGKYDVGILNTFKDLTTSLRSELNSK